MGTEYYVACRDCKMVRGLDKFYAMTTPANGRSDAIALGVELQQEGWSFRCGLLTSFLWQHKGHNCTVFSEHDEEFMSMVPVADDGCEYEEDSDKFWRRLGDDPRGPTFTDEYLASLREPPEVTP